MATKYGRSHSLRDNDSLPPAEAEETAPTLHAEQVAEDLARFGNVKNEFVIYGQLASFGLFRGGHVEESIKVCNQVLAVDPPNEEMNRLKERLTRFQNSPNASQLIKEEFMKQESPIRKLRRSVSEIKSKKPESFENGISEGPENSRTSMVTNRTRHTISNGASSNGAEERAADTPNSCKIARTQSLGPRRTKSTGVLQKIQQFEQAAEKRNSAPAHRPIRRMSRKPSEDIDTVLEGEVLPPDSGFISGSSLDNSAEAVPIQIKQEVFTPPGPSPKAQKAVANGHSQALPPSKIHAANGHPQPTSPPPARKPAHFTFSLPSETNGSLKSPSDGHPPTVHKPPKSPTTTRSNSFNRQFSTELANSATKIVIARKARPGCNAEWTDHGIKTFSEELVQKLEVEFFNSNLIMRGCILSPEGNILCLTAGFRIKNYEIQTLLTGMADASFLTASKLTIGGIQYSCLSGTHTVVRARTKDRGIGINCTKFKPICISTPSSPSNSRLSLPNSRFTNGGGMTIVVLYEHPVLPKQIAMLVKDVGNILENEATN